MGQSQDITSLLLDLQGGNRTAVNQLFPLLYQQLHNMAQKQLHSERKNHTLNTTGLVHEAYLRLVDQSRVGWQNRAHFLAIAAQAMRRILINYARSRSAQKRGGGAPLAVFDDSLFITSARAEALIDLDQALSRIKEFDERQSKVVEYRFFGGLTHKEIAGVLNVSVPTVRRDWRLARAWLSRELKKSHNLSAS